MLFAVVPAAAELEWINKDFKNTTGQNRNDLHWSVLGHIEDEVVTTYNPPELPNLEVEETGPAPMTHFRWSGGNVADGEEVHAGVLIDRDDLPGGRFMQHARWSLDGVTKERVAGCASVNFEFTDAIAVSGHNTMDPDGPAMVVFDFAYAIVNNAVALGDLTRNNSDIPYIQVPGSAILEPASSAPLIEIENPEDGRYIIFQMSAGFVGEPADSAGHIIVQRLINPEAVPVDIDAMPPGNLDGE